MKLWFDEMKKEKTKDDGQFFEIRFAWHFDTFIYFNKKTSQNENSLSKYLTFSAMAKSDERENREERYSTSFSDIQNLRDLPVAFDYNCELSIWNPETKKLDILFTFEENITLRELIACLFNEITFYGDPESTNEQKEKLNESLKEYEDLDRNDETKFIPFSKIKLEWLEKELKEALSEENFEWAENVRKEIKRIENEED